MAGYRVNYKGANLLVESDSGLYKLARVTAFGSTGTLSREDVFELGRNGIVDIVEDVTEVSATIDANEYGTHRTLAILLGMAPDDRKAIDLSVDADMDKGIKVRNVMSPSGATNFIEETLENVYLSGYSANFTVDGNATESFSLVSDVKKWKTLASMPSGITSDSNTRAGAKRRKHIKAYLCDAVNGAIKELEFSTAEEIHVQSVSIDASLEREDIARLGKLNYEYRPLVLPMTVNVSFDVIFKDLSILEQIAGKSGDISIDDFGMEKGLLVRVLDDEDGDVEKELHVPYLIPNDEAFNVSLDGNATHTFSFRSHELLIVDESVTQSP